MGKIFLRRSRDNNPLRPYSVESDMEDCVGRAELGDIVVLLPTHDGRYVFGVSTKENYAVHIAIGVVDSEKDLTSKVYEGSVEYCKRLTRSLPEKFEFVNETKGPRKIEIHTL